MIVLSLDSRYIYFIYSYIYWCFIYVTIFVLNVHNYAVCSTCPASEYGFNLVSLPTFFTCDAICIFKHCKNANGCHHTISIATYVRKFNLLKPKTYIMYHQFNIKNVYFLLHTVYLCVLCGSENKQRLFPYRTLLTCSYN